ncbi:HPP family protein [Rhodopirellula sp. JC740]|uniref:HPP family protein n=1 Tax=Rhodopirellula halodulae TaxID=2894198 RepID=A0ABS8NNF6_9BACT|nr:HPP family protein [Rhodopirellula sp. JC740]MCC9645108.1 HPP family protein [Rhodopirellula sp. JC740]
MRALRWLGIEIVETSFTDKLVSTIGATCAILCVIWITQWNVPAIAAAGVVASMGASAVLLYAVPHGPLSQPWPVLAGHTLSAIIGVTCQQWISHPGLATAAAVGLAIGLMIQCRCIHPPGGATAFTAVMGGTAIHELGYVYVIYPVFLNALVMASVAVLINSPFAWRRYPAAWRIDHKENVNSQQRELLLDHERVLAAIRSLDTFVDISEDDLTQLVQALNESMPSNQSPSESAPATVRLRQSESRWQQSDESDSSISVPSESHPRSS